MSKTAEQLEAEILALRNTLGTLIAWMVQSANSPIRGEAALKLLEMLVVVETPETKRDFPAGQSPPEAERQEIER